MRRIASALLLAGIIITSVTACANSTQSTTTSTTEADVKQSTTSTATESIGTPEAIPITSEATEDVTSAPLTEETEVHKQVCGNLLLPRYDYCTSAQNSTANNIETTIMHLDYNGEALKIVATRAPALKDISDDKEYAKSLLAENSAVSYALVQNGLSGQVSADSLGHSFTNTTRDLSVLQTQHRLDDIIYPKLLTRSAIASAASETEVGLTSTEIADSAIYSLEITETASDVYNWYTIFIYSEKKFEANSYELEEYYTQVMTPVIDDFLAGIEYVCKE